MNVNSFSLYLRTKKMTFIVLLLLCLIVRKSISESIEEEPGDQYFGVPLGALHFSSDGTSAEVYAADEFTIVFNHFNHNPQQKGCTAMMVGPPRPEDTENVIINHGILLPLSTAPPAKKLAKQRIRRRVPFAFQNGDHQQQQFQRWPPEFDHLILGPQPQHSTQSSPSAMNNQKGEKQRQHKQHQLQVAAAIDADPLIAFGGLQIATKFTPIVTTTPQDASKFADIKYFNSSTANNSSTSSSPSVPQKSSTIVIPALKIEHYAPTKSIPTLLPTTTTPPSSLSSASSPIPRLRSISRTSMSPSTIPTIARVRAKPPPSTHANKTHSKAVENADYLTQSKFTKQLPDGHQQPEGQRQNHDFQKLSSSAEKAIELSKHIVGSAFDEVRRAPVRVEEKTKSSIGESSQNESSRKKAQQLQPPTKGTNNMGTERSSQRSILHGIPAATPPSNYNNKLTTTTPLFWVIKDPREGRRKRLLELKRRLEQQPSGEDGIPITTTQPPFIPFDAHFELPKIRDKLVTFTLTNGAKITQYKWVGLYNQCTKKHIPLVSLRDVDPPREEKIMPISGWSHNVTSYRLHILNCNTILVPSFHYDGRNTTKNTFFFAGIGQFPDAIERQIRVIVVGNQAGEPLRDYKGEDVLLHLPRGYRTFDIDFISIYNLDEQKSFGHVIVPSLLVPPCSEDDV